MSDSRKEITWRVHEGFACSIVLILSSLGINQGLRITYENYPVFAGWAKDNPYYAEGSFMILRGFIWVLLAYLFSRDSSIQRFIRGAGFAHRPSFSGWLLTWGAIAIGLFELYVMGKGLSNPNQFGPGFYYGGEATWSFFVLYTVVFSPFCEEAVMRGFLYPAFRHSLGVLTSVILVTCVQVYFHWGLVSRDLAALCFLVAGGITLCIIREQTRNTWNCVLFHGAFNAVVIRQWPLCLIGMLLTLLASESHRGQKSANPVKEN